MGASDGKWYELKKEQLYTKLWAYLQYLQRTQSYRTKQNLENMNLYGDYEAAGLAPHSYARSNSLGSLYPKVTYNLIKSMVDTAHNRIAQNRVLPFFLTEDGDWSQQERGKKLNQFIEGLFFETNFYEVAQQIFLDACIFGTGFLHVYDADPDGKGRVAIERCFTEEIRIDDNQAAFASPHEMHREKFASRDRLLAMCNGDKQAIAAIMKAQPTKLSQNQSTSQYTHDMIPVVESWRLPTGPIDEDNPQKTDGKRALIIETGTLELSPYPYDYFPIIPFRWNVRPLGYYGLGISGQLRGTQYEVNNVLRVMSRGLRLSAVPRLLIPYGSRVNPQHITNDPGGLIWHAPGMAPQYLTGAVFPPEFYQWLEGLIAKAYQQVGISELTAQQKKPAGINSGRGLRELTDIQGDRFATIEQRWESFILSAAKLMILKARDIAKRNGYYEVKVGGKDSFSRIRFTADDLDPNDFMMRVWPTNLLPKTPSGKFEMVSEMMDKNLLSPPQAKRLLNYPDIESAMGLETAGQDHIHKCIEVMIEEGKYTPPAPYHALDYGLEVVHEALLKYEMKGAPDDRLDLLRTWLTQAQALVAAKNPTPAAQPGAPPGGPPGMPPGAPPPGLPPGAAPPMPMPAAA